MDTILNALNNLQIPDMGDDKEYLHGNHVQVQQDANNVLFETDVANNALKLTANKLTAKYNCDSFRAHEWIFVAKGHLEVDMNDVNIGLGLKFKTQTLADGRVVPAVEAVDVLVDIDRNDIKLHIWGNIWTDFASAFEIFFKGTVVDDIRDAIRSTLETTVPDYINEFLAQQDGALAISDFTEGEYAKNWFLDW